MDPIFVVYGAMAIAAMCLLIVAYDFLTKGFTGSMFGAHILSKSRRIGFDGGLPMWGHARVYTLQTGGRRLVGIEVIDVLGFDAIPFRLKPETARALAAAIEDAADQS